MKAEVVRSAVEGLHGCMTFEQAAIMTNLILDNRFQAILELGFDHGVSTCYMAAALHELGGGHITTIDLNSARNRQPSIDRLLSQLGLSQFVTPMFEPTSYTWRLMKMLAEDASPRFDFCYIDGAHDWFNDGFAFLLVDRLLKPNGLVLFDDLDWTYDISPSLKNTERVKLMAHDERITPQVRKVYELLVKTHAGYGDFVEQDGWAYARKLAPDTGSGTAGLRREVVHVREHVGLGAAVLKIARRLAR